MNLRFYPIGLLMCCAGSLWPQSKPPEMVALTAVRGSFHPVFKVQEIEPALLAKINNVTWHAGCPVPASDLRELRVSYWNFKGEPDNGSLVVNRAVAKDLRKIFQRLFRHGFMIERMEPVETYAGNDERSMEANNTSSFNCRDVTGRKGKFSNHSWGRAIDINPLTNPYRNGTKVLPEAGKGYLDRSRAYPGGILAGSYIVQLFKKKGWNWGGDWTRLQDFQHFEKPKR